MTALDSAVTAYVADVAAIGLSTTSGIGGEVIGGGYDRLAPGYGAAAGGSADIVATLEFSGPAGTTVTHGILVFDDATTVLRPLPAPVAFNSDGRLDLTSAAVTAVLSA